MLDNINDVIRKEGYEEFDGDLKNFAGGSRSKKLKKGKSSEKGSDIKTDKSEKPIDKTEKVSNFFARKNNVNLNSIYNKTEKSETLNPTSDEKNENMSQEVDTNSINLNVQENNIQAGSENKESSLLNEKTILDESSEKINTENSQKNETPSEQQDQTQGLNKFEENVNSTNLSNSPTSSIQKNGKKSKDNKDAKDACSKILDDAPFILNDIPTGSKNKKSSKKKDKKKSRSHHGDSSLDNLFGSGGIIVITQSFHHNDNESVRLIAFINY
jgi:hypothetical protein